jgi:hypothetical protein
MVKRIKIRKPKPCNECGVDGTTKNPIGAMSGACKKCSNKGVKQLFADLGLEHPKGDWW